MLTGLGTLALASRIWPLDERMLVGYGTSILCLGIGKVED